MGLVSRAQPQSRRTIIGYTEIWVTVAVGGGEEGERHEILKISLLGWGDGFVVKVPTLHAQGPEFGCPAPPPEARSGARSK